MRSPIEQLPDEESPLLARSALKSSHSKIQLTECLAEMWILTKAAVPIILGYMLQNSIQTASIIIAGNLSSEALAVAAFSYMFAMATAWLVALGGTGAIDTLASSSFTASSDKSHLGILLQRGIVVLSGFYAVIMIIWALSEPIFRALGQSESISIQSARFLWILAPGGLGYVWFECMKKFLQAQEIYRPGTYVLLATAPLNALLNHVFVHTLEFGLYGAPAATGVCYWLSFFLLVAYTALIEGKECWGGFQPALALSNTRPFIKLAFLGVVQVGTEWWAFEIVALAAGRLGAIPLAAQSVIMTLDQITNNIPFGMGVASSVRLGNLLGGKDARRAKVSAYSAALLSVLVGCALLAVLLSMRAQIGRLFTDEEEVLALVSDLILYVALFQIADGLNGVCGGILRGFGRQSTGALVSLVSYYGAALPTGLFLAFHGWGLSGLWLGQSIALSCAAMLEFMVVAFTDWDVEVIRATERLHRSQ
ncbi:hypothetical protein NQ176_g1755 [Zarea fungicola]|uniref:Uncharacterized protein n=1 Tax=Zarea fungicola TaxID=93591 RepID=A0ACC1NU62_9HYPO|nr:hypothetical protein NQ176_g1755 [Lecanicillium fungicola]